MSQKSLINHLIINNYIRTFKSLYAPSFWIIRTIDATQRLIDSQIDEMRACYLVRIITDGLTSARASWQVIRYYYQWCRGPWTNKKHGDEPGTRARVIPVIQMMIIDAVAVCGVMVWWPFSGAAISIYRSRDMNDRINTETLTDRFYFNILTTSHSSSSNTFHLTRTKVSWIL